MTLFGTAVLVLLAWLVAALVVGLVVGRAIRRRDLQVSPTEGPGLVVVPEPVVPDPAPAPAELTRLLAALDRAEDTNGSDGEITDLVRIWAARSAAGSAERELNQAIEAARRNGHSWDAIQAVLELPLPGTLESSPD